MHPGCPALSSQARCPLHQQKRESEWQQQRERWASTESRKQRAALYKSREWALLRRAVLAEEPGCRACGAEATVVDHVVPHLGDPALFYERSNLQALCKRCHDAKTSREDSWNRKREQT